MSTVKQGDVVNIECEGKLPDGKIFFKIEKEKPLKLKVGQGAIFPELESNLIDMQIGQTKEVTLTPDQAYGEYQEQLLLSAPYDKFGEDFNPEVGKKVTVELQDNKRIMGVITEIEDNIVTIDFNHPLAGKTIIFIVTVISIENQ
jgi:peptidylprolyl isomerase